MSGPSELGSESDPAEPTTIHLPRRGRGGGRCRRSSFSWGSGTRLAAAPPRARRRERVRRSPRGRRGQVRPGDADRGSRARRAVPAAVWPPGCSCRLHPAGRGLTGDPGRPGHPRAGPRRLSQGRRRGRQRRSRVPHRLGPRRRPSAGSRATTAGTAATPCISLASPARASSASRSTASNGTATIHDTDRGVYDHDTVWDRVVGPMKFIPGTWRTVGGDLDGDGVKDPQDINDAAAATAIYLCAGPGDLADPGQCLHRRTPLQRLRQLTP